jgi:hypothetical protein
MVAVSRRHSQAHPHVGSLQIVFDILEIIIYVFLIVNVLFTGKIMSLVIPRCFILVSTILVGLLKKNFIWPSASVSLDVADITTSIVFDHSVRICKTSRVIETAFY